jgi:hypothetical protein
MFPRIVGLSRQSIIFTTDFGSQLTAPTSTPAAAFLLAAPNERTVPRRVYDYRKGQEKSFVSGLRADCKLIVNWFWTNVTVRHQGTISAFGETM